MAAATHLRRPADPTLSSSPAAIGHRRRSSIWVRLLRWRSCAWMGVKIFRLCGRVHGDQVDERSKYLAINGIPWGRGLGDDQLWQCRTLPDRPVADRLAFAN